MKNITGCIDVPHEASPSTKKSMADDQKARRGRSAFVVAAVIPLALITPLSPLPGVSYQLASPFADPDDCFANIKCSHWLFAKAVLNAGRYVTVSMIEIEVTVAI
jgi:hypothetical protein